MDNLGVSELVLVRAFAAGLLAVGIAAVTAGARSFTAIGQ